jgi:hypothetical protein
MSVCLLHLVLAKDVLSSHSSRMSCRGPQCLEQLADPYIGLTFISRSYQCFVFRCDSQRRHGRDFETACVKVHMHRGTR